MARLRESVPVPLATGERDRTIWEVREILEAQVVDILQPDCGHGGAIAAVEKAGGSIDVIEVVSAAEKAAAKKGKGASKNKAKAEG